MTTRDGVRVIRTAAPFDPAELGRIAAPADERPGGVMSSGMEDPRRGLCGACGCGLAFQFEPVRPRLDRPATQRDLVLHLPDEIWVMDRKREEAVRYSYDFEVGGVSTAGLDRATAGTGAGRETQPVRDQDLPQQPRPGRYARVVEDARERFARGDLFEVVPSHVFYGRCTSPAAFYQLLRPRNPAPYEVLFNP